MVTRSRAPVVTKNWLQGDLKPEPQNQLELKVNASIQWITTVNASIEFKRYIYIFFLYGDWQFSLFLLWKWNNNYSETKQCEESLRKTAKTRQFREKGTSKNKHIQNALITSLMTSCPSFGHEINCQVKHYLTANFLCRVIKGWLSTALGLVSRLSRSCSLLP